MLFLLLIILLTSLLQLYLSQKNKICYTVFSKKVLAPYIKNLVNNLFMMLTGISAVQKNHNDHVLNQNLSRTYFGFS